ncbi:MAG: hypothetical protein K2Z81_03090, partial [Cyanobacteria bacterium]|nr:hypothetical protein [Cyanobacteriota bacterium]
LCFVSLDFTTINIVLAAQVYPIGENGEISSGLIWSAFGIGALVGPWLSSKVSDGTPRMILKINTFVTALGVTSAWSLLWLSVSLDSLFGIQSVAVAVAIMSLSSFFRGCYACTLWTNSQVLLQLTAKNQMLGRMFGIDWIFLNIGQVYSTLVQGAMIDVFGLERINLILATSLAAGLLPNIPWVIANLWLAHKKDE